jgi:fructokinase
MIRIGVDFGGTKIEAAALDGDGRFQARVRGPSPGDYQGGLEAVRHLVEEAERQAGVTVARIGVGGPGSPSPAGGLMRGANSTQLNGHPFPQDLARVLEREVRYANDANCLALSEARDGAAAGAGVVFAAILGTGVGAGLAVDRRILAGRNSFAGEWGHAPLPCLNDREYPGPASWGLRRGSIEVLLSLHAIAGDAGHPD